MLLLSVLLIVALCQVPIDGFQCYKGSTPIPGECTDTTSCQIKFTTTLKAFACGCDETAGAGCFYLPSTTVCCCDTDSCNDPKTVTSRKCWEGEGPDHSSYKNSTSCLTLNIPGAKFCVQEIKGQKVTSARCGCTRPTTTGKAVKVTCECEKNECTGGDTERVCCCDTDNCNDPDKPLFTTTTTPTTSPPTTARPDDTTDDYDDDLPTAKPFKVIYKPRPRESFCDGDWLCWLTCAFATIAATLFVGMLSVAGYAFWVWRRTQH